MYIEDEAVVLGIAFEDDEIQQLVTDKGAKRALLYKRMTRPANVGDRIIVNMTATELALGTGGWDIVRFVHAPKQKKEWMIGDARGHIMKARYTPIQHSVLAVEAQESKYHDHFQEPFTLAGHPVWLAELHSMVPLIYYVLKEMNKGLHCCVIFDDQAALPLPFSEQLRKLHKEVNFSSITVGQSFGGQYEAINITSALQYAAVILHADVIVISVGPGVVGTGTYYGFSGMSQSHWSHTVSALGGVPIWIPRISFADKRKRHYGISHHTLTPLGQFTFKESIVPIPYVNERQKKVIKQQIDSASFHVGHDIRFAEEDHVSEFVKKALQHAPLPIQTMGRKYEDDPAFFLAVAEALRVGLALM
ncbi:DUF3866 family protein [bacterium LRH843]|nr:DUF3866 family protein [bacterium LRH843]